MKRERRTCILDVLWSSAALLVALALYPGASPAAAASVQPGNLMASGDRLAPESTVLVSAGADEVSALAQALPFHFANVTLPEQRLAVSRTVGTTFTHQLAELQSSPVKKLRTSAVQCVDRPLKIRLVDDFNVHCLEGGVAMLVSLANVHVKNGRYFAQLSVHLEGGGTVTSTNLALPLAALNPFLWGNDRPRNVGAFRGTAICLSEGGKLQIVEGWPVRVPRYTEGPWEITVMVERAFLTPSSDKKQHLLHADLKVLKVPRDVKFMFGPQPATLPFAGYVKLPTKLYGLEAAIIRERVVGKSCRLRRKETKTTVELKCDELIDAKVASLNKLYKDRPPLMHTLKGAGLLMAGSMGAFTVAAFIQMLGNIDGSKLIADPEGCVAVGAVAAVVSLLALLVDAPVVGYKYWRWRKKYRRKAARILERAVAHETKDPTTKSRFLDLVLVIPAGPYGGTADGGGSGEIAPSLNEGQERAYADLAELLKTRAEVASFAELPFQASELERFGMREPQKGAEQLLRLNERSLITGIGVDDDGKAIIPPHMSASRMYETIAVSSRSLIEDLLNTPPQPTFAVELLRAQLTRRNLWREWSELAATLNAGCHDTDQQSDPVPLAVWADIYQRLTKSKSMLSEAGFEPELMEKLLGVQAEQETAMRELIEERLQEETKVLAQLIANLRGGAPEPTDVAALQERSEKLKAVVEAVGLPDKLMQPVLRSLAKYMEGSQSDMVELEPLEEATSGVGRHQELYLYQGPNIEIEDDRDIEMINIDDS